VAKSGVTLPAEIQVGNAKSAKTSEPAGQIGTSNR